ncbi:dUTP diphosphatase [Paracoccus sp. MKU1]|uniref:dUTP diphosphatase n=1 Tax=Paracoccus sp. MKU1 TaxID=1745182 RepID=UPI0007191C7D|nr:dUTP diphosphatase [Paracoccus sp. MKU1]KRW94336.1 deoxyuridine 5'-triphosphate nucleotidohydrolase [Paracoccus sp. MKU1]
MQIALCFKPRTAHAKLPTYETEGAAGFDLSFDSETTETVFPGKRRLLGTGVYVGLPVGYELQVRPRSGRAMKEGLTVLNSPGTIDSDYRGEVKVLIINHGEEPVVIHPGDRIAQGVVSMVPRLPMVLVDTLDATQRGENGFGSTGN